MPKAPAKRPDAYRSLYLAVQEILNDEAPSNAAHREWLLTRLMPQRLCRSSANMMSGIGNYWIASCESTKGRRHDRTYH
jgi:hypothetical protein